MPATIPSHPAAVLPLKLASPRRFDGVALVVGTGIPDAGYLTQGIFPGVPSHAWHSVVWFSIPLTVVVTYLVRRASSVVAAHLPEGGPLALRDYGVLAKVRHPLAVTVWSAALGALSHVIWDMFTHPYVLFGHPFTGDGTHFGALHQIAFAGLPWWRVLHLASELAGILVVVIVAVHIGRRRLLREWHGPAPVVPCRPFLFWPATAAGFALLTAIALVLPGNTTGPNVIGVRLIAAAVLALLGAAALVGARHGDG